MDSSIISIAFKRDGSRMKSAAKCYRFVYDKQGFKQRIVKGSMYCKHLCSTRTTCNPYAWK